MLQREQLRLSLHWPCSWLIQELILLPKGDHVSWLQHWKKALQICKVLGIFYHTWIYPPRKIFICLKLYLYHPEQQQQSLEAE